MFNGRRSESLGLLMVLQTLQEVCSIIRREIKRYPGYFSKRSGFYSDDKEQMTKTRRSDNHPGSGLTDTTSSRKPDSRLNNNNSPGKK